MKYTREVEKDASGKVVCIAESLSFESDEEYKAWWDRATETMTPPIRKTKPQSHQLTDVSKS